MKNQSSEAKNLDLAKEYKCVLVPNIMDSVLSYSPQFQRLKRSIPFNFVSDNSALGKSVKGVAPNVVDLFPSIVDLYNVTKSGLIPVYVSFSNAVNDDFKEDVVLEKDDNNEDGDRVNLSRLAVVREVKLLQNDAEIIPSKREIIESKKCEDFVISDNNLGYSIVPVNYSSIRSYEPIYVNVNGRCASKLESRLANYNFGKVDLSVQGLYYKRR